MHDDPGFRTFVRARLERAGLAVEMAVDGDDALRALSVAEPRLVLVDVCLPRTSGYEVYRELKEPLRRDASDHLHLGRARRQL